MYNAGTCKRTEWIFVTLTPFSRSREGLDLLENGFYAPYLLNESMDFDQTCTAILLRHRKELIRFGDLDPIFKVTVRLKLLVNCLSAPYLPNE